MGWWLVASFWFLETRARDVGCGHARPQYEPMLMYLVPLSKSRSSAAAPPENCITVVHALENEWTRMITSTVAARAACYLNKIIVPWLAARM